MCHKVTSGASWKNVSPRNTVRPKCPTEYAEHPIAQIRIHADRPPRSFIASLSLVLTMALSIAMLAAADPPLRIFAAGSLVGPMNE